MARHSTLQRDTMPRRMLKGKVSRQRGHSFQYRATFISCTTTHKNDQHWFHRHDALHQATSSPIIACICLDELLLPPLREMKQNIARLVVVNGMSRSRRSVQREQPTLSMVGTKARGICDAILNVV